MRYSEPVKWIAFVAALSPLAGCSEQEPASAPLPSPQAASASPAQATPSIQEDAPGRTTAMPPNLQQGLPGPPPPVVPLPAGGEPTRLAAVATLAEGKLSRDQVQQTIDAAADTLARCLVTETRVSLKIDVSSAGEVSAASVTSSDPDDPKVRDCVAATMKGLRFPPPEGREAMSLSMSLVLKPRVSL